MTRKLVLRCSMGTLIVIAAYSALGLMQTLMLSGAPNYSTDRVWNNVFFWGSTLIASTVLFIVLLLMGRRKKE